MTRYITFWLVSNGRHGDVLLLPRKDEILVSEKYSYPAEEEAARIHRNSGNDEKHIYKYILQWCNDINSKVWQHGYVINIISLSSSGACSNGGISWARTPALWRIAKHENGTRVERGAASIMGRKHGGASITGQHSQKYHTSSITKSPISNCHT